MGIEVIICKTLKQMIRDIRKSKKRIHKLNVRYKAKILALEKENKEIKQRIDELEYSLSLVTPI